VSRRQRLGLAAAYASVTFLSFPHPVGTSVLDLGLLLSWASPALLLLSLEGLSPWRAARVGFLAAWVAHTAILHWIYVVTVVYGHAPPLVGIGAPALLATYMGLAGGAFGGGAAWLAARGVRSPFVLAALWTCVDHARSFVFTGFPWATLGYAQHENGPLLGLASLTGVYGLSFTVALAGAALAEIARARHARRKVPRRAVAALAMVVVAHAVGAVLSASIPAPGPESVRVAVVQGNIGQDVKWSEAWMEETLSTYEALTRDAAGRGARIVVWPETAVPGAVDADADLRRRLEDLAIGTGAVLVVGAVGLAFDEFDQGRLDPTGYFDSAFTIDATGTFRDRYDKTHLVPFGEYVPFAALLGTFIQAVASGMTSVGVTPGPAPRALDLHVDGGVVRVGVPICYELLFPDIVRRFPLDGAEVLFGITNDAWYGRTGAPYQFLAITALRSAETRLWTARAANTGVSAFIDDRGRVRERTPIFERGLLVADVPLRRDPARASFYVRHGNVFAGACWLAAAAAALRVARRSGARSPRMSDAPAAASPPKEEA
jgi:apolipoprotein N-acyltransferase